MIYNTNPILLNGTTRHHQPITPTLIFLHTTLTAIDYINFSLACIM